MQEIEYINDKLLRIGEVEFELDLSQAVAKKQSTPDKYILLKTKKVIETYREYFASRKVDDLLEIGIQKGGSCALFNFMWTPRNHVAFELSNTAVPALDVLSDQVRRQGRSFNYTLGLNQADKKGVLSLARNTFGSDPEGVLDVIIDDASHLYEPSKISFNALFPLLRVGGAYVIEDWGWAHWRDFQGPTAHWHNEIALTNLVFEIIMMAATRPDIARNISMTSVNMIIERGPAAIDPAIFDVSKAFLSRGKELNPI